VTPYGAAIVDWYSVLKDFAGPVATVIAAVTAAGVASYFAFQQAKTAKRQAETAIDQLRFNVFEKRYAVYREPKQFLQTLLIDQSSSRREDLERQFIANLDEAKFLFSPKTCDWLEAIWDDYLALLEKSSAPAASNAQDRAALKLKLYGHLKAMPEHFHDLSFQQLTRLC
jgi:hypothetical protein